MRNQQAMHASNKVRTSIVRFVCLWQGLNLVGVGGSWDPTIPTPLTQAPTPYIQAPTSHMQAPTPYTGSYISHAGPHILRSSSHTSMYSSQTNVQLCNYSYIK